jgi:hypothetical protein
MANAEFPDMTTWRRSSFSGGGSGGGGNCVEVAALWRKSRFSGGGSSGGGDCVETATLGNADVGVRDSKQPNGAVLRFSPAAMAAYLRAVKHRG